MPLTCAILVGLFSIQRLGTGAVGKLFGPVMVIWFGTLAGLGIFHISHHPEILAALSPHHGVAFFLRHGIRGVLILGSVVLVVTGGEALYADMGHFGVRPIRIAWTSFVLPALVLGYFGQGALILTDPKAIENPFFAMVPAGLPTYLLVLLSSAATVIASQALISGAFSLTRQAMLLGYLPRVTVKHTAFYTEGQIYIPEVNRLLAAGCILLVLTFRESVKLAAAYGIAVTGTMAITSVLYFIVARYTWHWSAWKAGALLVFFLSFDIPFLAANLFKFFDGGYVPMMIGAALIAGMLIWSRGRTALIAQYSRRYSTFEKAKPLIHRFLCSRVPGSAVFLAPDADHVPPVLMHHVERSRSLHETVVLLTVKKRHCRWCQRTRGSKSKCWERASISLSFRSATWRTRCSSLCSKRSLTRGRSLSSLITRRITSATKRSSRKTGACTSARSDLLLSQPQRGSRRAALRNAARNR